MKKIVRLSDEQKVALGRSLWICLDCGQDTFISEEYYMLWYRVWRSLHYKMNGMLCLNCAETRLGRQLVASDFSKAPVNQIQALRCPALALRLTRR
jgi:hypothetical protein